MRWVAPGMLCVLTLAIVVGCGEEVTDKPAIGTVHGKVTLDGQPLAGVEVTFKPENGRSSMSISDAEGQYTAMYLADEEGVKIGPSRVSVQWSEESPGAPIPAKYGPSGDLTLDVKAGDNEFNIEMASK